MNTENEKNQTHTQAGTATPRPSAPNDAEGEESTDEDDSPICGSSQDLIEGEKKEDRASALYGAAPKDAGSEAVT